MSLRLLAPAQPGRLTAALAGVHRALVVEQNHTAQLFHYLKGWHDVPCGLASLCKPGGQQFNAGELYLALTEWSRA